MSKDAVIKERKLDFSECAYIGEVYAVIKRELELPDWCGENLDALWDAITGMMYTPARVTIVPTARRKDLKGAIDDIVSLFQEVEQTYHEITVNVEQKNI